MRGKKVLIVGSGVAATTVARRVLERNDATVVDMFEAGPDFRTQNWRWWTDFVTTGRSPNGRYLDKPSDADINPEGGFELVGGRMIVKGGSTNHWGGWAPRMKPEDFRLGDVRKGALNWQISYEDLAHYYTDAEHLLDVCGSSETLTPPRYGARYKHQPIPYTAMDGLLMEALSSLGENAFEPMPMARDATRCQTTGTCRYCPFGARYTAAADVDQLASTFGKRFRLHLESPVVAVRMRSRRTAAGVTVGDKKSHNTVHHDGDVTVIAAGTIESAKILLNSVTTTWWPKGLGNSTDHVGRHIVTHPLLRAVARIPNNSTRLEQEVDFPTMASRFYDSVDFQSRGKMFFARDGRYILPNFAEKLISRSTINEVNDQIIRNTRIELRGLIEAFPDEDNRVELIEGPFATSGLPRTRIRYRESEATITARHMHLVHLEGVLRKAGLQHVPQEDSGGARADHAVATCRMSRSPAEGVVDRDLRVHETDNVFVCSNAVMPNPGAVNPTLTLAALALRLGDLLGA